MGMTKLTSSPRRSSALGEVGFRSRQWLGSSNQADKPATVDIEGHGEQERQICSVLWMQQDQDFEIPVDSLNQAS